MLSGLSAKKVSLISIANHCAIGRKLADRKVDVAPTEHVSAIRAGRAKLATCARWTHLATGPHAMRAAVGRRRARGMAAARRMGGVSASWGTGGTCAIGACRATMGMIARFNVTHMTPAMGAVGAMRMAAVSARTTLLGPTAPSALTAERMLTAT